MLQERIREWAQNHINQGIEIGLEKGMGIGREEGIGIGRLAGQKDSLRNILELKFGEVPSAWLTRISALDSEKLVYDLIAGAFVCQDYNELENYLSKLAG